MLLNWNLLAIFRLDNNSINLNFKFFTHFINYSIYICHNLSSFLLNLVNTLPYTYIFISYRLTDSNSLLLWKFKMKSTWIRWWISNRDTFITRDSLMCHNQNVFQLSCVVKWNLKFKIWEMKRGKMRIFWYKIWIIVALGDNFP